MLFRIMMKILLISLVLFLSACTNTRGFSGTYYNDCKEYYDLQGFYHKDCDENIVEYKEIKDAGGKIIDTYVGKKEKPRANVW